MLRLKCLLLESSKSNFAKEIHFGKWNPHESFIVTSSRSPLSQFVVAMYNPSQSYSGAFRLSFICNINRNDGNVTPSYAICSVLGPNFLTAPYLVEINVYNPLSRHQNTTKKPYSPTEVFVIVFFNTESCMHNEVYGCAEIYPVFLSIYRFKNELRYVCIVLVSTRFFRTSG